MDNQQRGLGLPELLIALLLASLITLGLMRHYLNTKQHYNSIQMALEQSIELQLVTDLIRNSARKAGFTPCLGVEHLITSDPRNAYKKLVPIEVGANEKPSLQMNRMSEHFDTVLETLSPTDLLITSYQKFHNSQIVLIADCYHAEVQEILHVNRMDAAQKVTLTRPLSFTYHPPVYIGAWVEETYSIHVKPRSKGSLFYHLQHAEELTTAVHNLSAHLKKNPGGTLLQVTLGLDQARSLELETMVRIQ